MTIRAIGGKPGDDSGFSQPGSPLNLLLSQLDPSPRNLNQISSVLPADLLRHVEALGRTIKVEVAFRFHVPPFWYLWPYLKTGTPVRSMPGFPVKRFKERWPSRLRGKAKLGQKHRRPSTLPLNTKFSAELRKVSAQGPPQLTAAELGRTALCNAS
jgi:hypothetical protein